MSAKSPNGKWQGEPEHHTVLADAISRLIALMNPTSSKWHTQLCMFAILKQVEHFWKVTDSLTLNDENPTAFLQTKLLLQIGIEKILAFWQNLPEDFNVHKKQSKFVKWQNIDISTFISTGALSGLATQKGGNYLFRCQLYQIGTNGTFRSL